MSRLKCQPVPDAGCCIFLLLIGMIEHGLIESANYGIHKHISQNMKTTSVDSMGSEGDDFMEIRYDSIENH